jgi:hypothetical protein
MKIWEVKVTARTGKRSRVSNKVLRSEKQALAYLAKVEKFYDLPDPTVSVDVSVYERQTVESMDSFVSSIRRDAQLDGLLNVPDEVSSLRGMMESRIADSFVRDAVLADWDVTRMSEVKARSSFFSKWKVHLLVLCKDPDWYDALLAAANYKTFCDSEIRVHRKKVLEHGEYVEVVERYVWVGSTKVYLSGQEEEFVKAKERRKSKGK